MWQSNARRNRARSLTSTQTRYPSSARKPQGQTCPTTSAASKYSTPNDDNSTVTLTNYLQIVGTLHQVIWRHTSSDSSSESASDCRRRTHFTSSWTAGTSWRAIPSCLRSTSRGRTPTASSTSPILTRAPSAHSEKSQHRNILATLILQITIVDTINPAYSTKAESKILSFILFNIFHFSGRHTQ